MLTPQRAHRLRFEIAAAERMRREAPLARRVAPRTLDDFVGQEHILGAGKLLRRAIEAALMGESDV